MKKLSRTFTKDEINKAIKFLDAVWTHSYVAIGNEVYRFDSVEDVDISVKVVGEIERFIVEKCPEAGAEGSSSERG